MANKETILRVKDLRISFRTVSGKVQAVRNISFDLAKGETLAIVGESGSGKSVTNRAIMGILANNGIIESGEVLYDGMDLLKISEKEFCRLRGDKIAMIFQDPLSSLNPIVRIGKQLTEATLLKNLSNRKESKENFNKYLENLNTILPLASKDDPEFVSNGLALLKEYQETSASFIELENPYNNALNDLKNTLDNVNDLIFNIENKADFDIKELVQETFISIKGSLNFYAFPKQAEALAKIEVIKDKVHDLIKKKASDYLSILDEVKEVKVLVDEALNLGTPDLFAYAYYFKRISPAFEEGLSIAEKNALAKAPCETNLIIPLTEVIAKCLRYSNEISSKAMKEAIDVLKENRKVFENEHLDENASKEAAKVTSNAVSKTIDPLKLTKDSYSYTFSNAINHAVEAYFNGLISNKKEEARYAKEKASYDKKVARGKKMDWKPRPAAILKEEMLKKNITDLIDNLISLYSLRLERNHFDESRINEVIPYLNTEATLSVYKVTQSMAKNQAIKLMKEVGIPQPRRRFRQYPFEFSGGMRQRIVIAIALAANPEILICDEPTTALDVTIQAQILELINKIKEERHLSIIFITHNLGVVANMADRIAVMYAGKIVEYGTADDIFYDPRHPYTWALLSSMPDLETKEKLEAIPGTPPNMIYPPEGDAFAPRNRYALKIDFKLEPPMFEVSPTHYAATWLCDPRSPKVSRPKIVDARIKAMKAKFGDEIEANLKANAEAEPDETYSRLAAGKAAPLNRD